MAKHWSLFLSTDFYKLECYSNKCVTLTGKTNYIKIISLLIEFLLPVSFILQYWLCLKWPSRLWSAESSVKHLVFLLGAAAVSLIVEHSEQHPQVQQGHRYEPHQNCGKEKRWSETRKLTATSLWITQGQQSWSYKWWLLGDTPGKRCLKSFGLIRNCRFPLMCKFVWQSCYWRSLL